MNVPKNNKLRFISRIEQKHFNCYVVRIGRTLPEHFEKTFGELEYGGKQKALKAAQAYRDEKQNHLENKFNISLPTTRRHKGKGIHYSCQDPSLGYACRWIASVWDGKKQLRKSYSINKYGHAKAKLLAKQWRKMKLKEVL